MVGEYMRIVFNGCPAPATACDIGAPSGPVLPGVTTPRPFQGRCGCRGLGQGLSATNTELAGRRRVKIRRVGHNHVRHALHDRVGALAFTLPPCRFRTAEQTPAGSAADPISGEFPTETEVNLWRTTLP